MSSSSLFLCQLVQLIYKLEIVIKCLTLELRELFLDVVIWDIFRTGVCPRDEFPSEGGVTEYWDLVLLGPGDNVWDILFVRPERDFDLDDGNRDDLEMTLAWYEASDRPNGPCENISKVVAESSLAPTSLNSPSFLS